MGKRAVRKNGGIEVPLSAIPRREYPTQYYDVWLALARMDLKKSSYEIDLTERGVTLNALRCSLSRAKRRGLVSPDIRIRDAGTLAYLYRESSR